MQARRAFKICIVRHGERADHVFGPNWTSQFFESDGSYVRSDLNMPLPEEMPRRPLEDWAIDPPITELGRWQARQVGSALGDVAEFHAIVCSPSLRCLQTAEEIRRVLPTRPGVVTEPGLYEMTSWGSPNVLELFNSNGDQYSITAVPQADEGVEAWYERSAKVFFDIVERHQMYGRADLLIIAHALSHEVLTYSMLWQNGTIPQEVHLASGHEAKIQALCNSSRCGIAPIESFCGVAVLNFSADGFLTPLNPTDKDSGSKPVPLWMTHRHNLPFMYKPFDDGAKHLARARSMSENTPCTPTMRTIGEQPILAGSISMGMARKLENGARRDDLVDTRSSTRPGTMPQVPQGVSSNRQRGSFVHQNGSVSFVSECLSPKDPAPGFPSGSQQLAANESMLSTSSVNLGSIRQSPPLLGLSATLGSSHEVRRTTTPLHAREANLPNSTRVLNVSSRDVTAAGNLWQTGVANNTRPAHVFRRSQSPTSISLKMVNGQRA